MLHTVNTARLSSLNMEQAVLWHTCSYTTKAAVLKQPSQLKNDFKLQANAFSMLHARIMDLKPHIPLFSTTTISYHMPRTIPYPILCRYKLRNNFLYHVYFGNLYLLQGGGTLCLFDVVGTYHHFIFCGYSPWWVLVLVLPCCHNAQFVIRVGWFLDKSKNGKRRRRETNSTPFYQGRKEECHSR